jgi:hypothetical protein
LKPLCAGKARAVFLHLLNEWAPAMIHHPKGQKIYLSPFLFPFSVPPDSLVGVLPNKGQVSRFLELCIRRRKNWLEPRAPQTAQKNINLEDLRPLMIPTPRQNEQEAIASIYEALDSSRSTSKQEIEKLRQQKQGLMHDLLTGRVQASSASSD